MTESENSSEENSQSNCSDCEAEYTRTIYSDSDSDHEDKFTADNIQDILNKTNNQSELELINNLQKSNSNQLNKILLKYLDKNKITPDIFSVYLYKWVMTSYRGLNKIDGIGKIFDIILDYLPLTKAHYQLIIEINKPNFILDILKKILDKNIKIPSLVLNKLLVSYRINKPEQYKFILDNIDPDSDTIANLYKSRFRDRQIYINKITNSGIKITKKVFLNSVKYGHQSDLPLNFIPDLDCLIFACKTLNIKLMTRILDHKITPTQDCFRAILYDIHINNFEQEKIAKAIDLLIAYAYQPDFSDISYCLKNSCYINNIEKYNLSEDQKNTLINICAEIGFWPYKKIFSGKPKLETLQAQFLKSNNLENIKYLISLGIEPDITCLKNACSVKQNITTIKYLLKNYGFKIEYLDLENYISKFGNATLKLMATELKNQKKI